METNIILCALAGGLVPSALRVLKWARDEKGQRSKSPLAGAKLYVGAAIHVALGLFGAYLLKASTELQAAAIGYAAPDIVTRLLGNASHEETSHLGDQTGEKFSLWQRLIQWWRY